MAARHCPPPRQRQGTAVPGLSNSYALEKGGGVSPLHFHLLNLEGRMFIMCSISCCTSTEAMGLTQLRAEFATPED